MAHHFQILMGFAISKQPSLLFLEYRLYNVIFSDLLDFHLSSSWFALTLDANSIATTTYGEDIALKSALEGRLGISASKRCFEFQHA